MVRDSPLLARCLRLASSIVSLGVADCGIPPAIGEHMNERGSWGRPGTVTADFPHRFQANHLNPWCIGRQPVDLVVANRRRPK
nr:hypothetical protein Iba_chr03bCG13720 [Ipomoea batatas]